MNDTGNKYAGSIPETYDCYLVPLIFDAYAKDLAERIEAPQGGAILETASGTGVLTRHVLKSVPETTHIVATDLNPAMLEVAERSLGHAGNVEFRVANGVELPFEDDSFDTVACQFGVMFFPDISLGYHEAARVLKPGGQFIFNVWDVLEKNGFSKSVHEAAIALDCKNPPDFLSLPYAYSNVSEISESLEVQGFVDIEVEILPKDSRANSAREVTLALAAGSPLAAQLAERSIFDEAIDRIEADLLREYGGGEIQAPMQAIVISARLLS